MAENPQETLFGMGAAAIPAAVTEAMASYEGPLAAVNRHETRVTFVAGMLAQYTFGEAPKKGRPRQQVEASTEAARRAFEYLEGTRG